MKRHRLSRTDPTRVVALLSWATILLAAPNGRVHSRP